MLIVLPPYIIYVFNQSFSFYIHEISDRNSASSAESLKTVNILTNLFYFIFIISFANVSFFFIILQFSGRFEITVD